RPRRGLRRRRARRPPAPRRSGRTPAQGRPRLLISAGSAGLQPDPDSPGLVRFLAHVTRRLSSSVLLLALTLGSSAQREQSAPAVTEIRLPGKRAVARLWNERADDGRIVPHYSVSADGE